MVAMVIEILGNIHIHTITHTNVHTHVNTYANTLTQLNKNFHLFYKPCEGTGRNVKCGIYFILDAAQ